MAVENFGAVEWMALILIIVSAVKILVILIKPRAWYDSVVKPVWKNPMITMVVCLILAAVALYYLVLSGITIVQILAVMLFFALFAAIGISIYQKEVLSLADKMLKDKTLVKKSWLYIILWIVLLGWGAKVLFGL